MREQDREVFERARRFVYRLIRILQQTDLIQNLPVRPRQDIPPEILIAHKRSKGFRRNAHILLKYALQVPAAHMNVPRQLMHVVVPDTCMDVIFTVNYTDNSLSDMFCGIDDRAVHNGGRNEACPIFFVSRKAQPTRIANCKKLEHMGSTVLPLPCTRFPTAAASLMWR